MNKMKKLLALMLAAVMALSLAACNNSFEAKLAKAVKKANDVKSMHMDMDMNIAMSLSLMGESLDMDMSMEMGMDFQKEPMLAKMEAAISMMGMTKTILSYIERNGDGYTMYMSEDGSFWIKEDVDADEVPSQVDGMGVEQLQLFLDCAKNFQEVGEETVNGSTATRYDGVIDGAYVAQAMEMTGALDMLDESLGAGLDIDGMEDLGGIPTSLWIDKKSGMIVRYDMDMTEIMGALTEGMMDAIMKEAGLGDFGLSFSLEISDVTVSATLSNFDQVGEIVIPDAAKAA